VIARRVELARQRGHQQAAVARAEQAFDRLNPDFGVPADTTNPYGHRDVQQRERALSLGVRVAVHDARQTTATRSSGSPARTTAPPTPSKPPAANPSTCVARSSGSAPNANPPTSIHRAAPR
jgi:hypothetical protein